MANWKLFDIHFRQTILGIWHDIYVYVYQPEVPIYMSLCRYVPTVSLLTIKKKKKNIDIFQWDVKRSTGWKYIFLFFRVDANAFATQFIHSIWKVIKYVIIFMLCPFNLRHQRKNEKQKMKSKSKMIYNHEMNVWKFVFEYAQQRIIIGYRICTKKKCNQYYCYLMVTLFWNKIKPNSMHRL